MPSETIDLQSLSSPSIFSDDIERQIGFWKSDTMLDQRAYNKPVTPSTMEKIIPVESQITRCLEHTVPFTKPHQKVNQCIDSRTVGAERVANQSPKFLEPINQGLGTKSSFGGENGFPSEEGTKVNTMIWQSENSLFSSSFSEFFTRKLNLSSNNGVHGNSIDTVASDYEGDEPFESLEELEAQTIGNLLPSDDELFSGVTEGLDSIVQPNGAEDAEELDVFSSVGGMDLGDDSPTVVQKHYKFPKDNGTSSGFNSAMKAPFVESTIYHGFSSSVSNSLTSMVGVGSIGSQSVITESGRLPMKVDVQGAPAFHPRLLPEYQNGSSPTIHSNSSVPRAANTNSKPLQIIGFPSAGNGNHPLPGRHYSWSNSYHPEPPSMMWPNIPSFVNGMPAARSTALLHGIPMTHTLNTGVPIINYHVGSAPTVNPSLWDRRHAYGGESSNSGFHPGFLGNMRGLRFLHPSSPVYNGRGQSSPVTRSVESPHEHARSRRNDGSMNQADRKQHELDIERIIQGEDKRTTLMLKNIPNKYTSKMLLAAIDERGGGTYDFIYLPIDFKNKCNMGYAFINMIEPSQVITFYQAFNGKKWEKFNSEKVASLAYGRIQGKEALVAHFQNSSLMNEDKRCRPILFNTDGLNVGDQVPFPVGINARARPGKARSAGHEENNIESPSSSENEVNSYNGGTCSSG